MLGVNFIDAAFKRARTKFNNNRLCNYLPYSFFIGREDEGIIFLKSGALMRTYSFICPDLGSASAESVNAISVYFNEAIKRLGSGWGMHFESRREVTRKYPGCSWDTELGYIIDSRRKDLFRNAGEHYLNYYFLTLSYQVSPDIISRGSTLLYKKEDDASDQEYYNLRNISKEIDYFRNMSDEAVSYIRSRLDIRELDNAKEVTYIKSCISTRWRVQQPPKQPQFFDHFITDEDVETGSTLKIGDRYVSVVAVRDFPAETYPAIFDLLCKANVEYRWVTRWIGMDKVNASKLIVKYQKRFNNSRKSWGQAFVEAAGNVTTDRVDAAAEAFEEETKDAKVCLSKDIVGFGYYTSCVEVWDKDYNNVISKAKYVQKLINSVGFSAKVETTNTFQAWLGMLPGNVYADVHKTLVSSGNCAHVIPLSSVWTGDFYNRLTAERFACSAPLVVGSSDGSPFFLNLNVGDVFHSFIFGPSGAGKSTFLCLLESQFLKYRDSQIIVLDKDKTARGVCMASGGSYVEPGADTVAFQPLRDLETEADLTWCQEFIELCLAEQNVELSPGQKESIRDALVQMRDSKVPERRDMTTFQLYVQDEDVKNGIQPYTLGGQYGNIFDAQDTNISTARFTMIEMGILMRMGRACVTPALAFLFRFIEGKFAKENDSDGHPSLLVMDEAWVFLDNPFFAKRIDDWLRTLRKKRVAVVFATQDVPSVAKSSISSTILSQCQTRFFLADPNAVSEILAGYYRTFGLSDSEIAALSMARMKCDYLYKSPNGTRMFQLELDDFQLALLCPPSKVLDVIEREYGRNSGREVAVEILNIQGFDPGPYMRGYRRRGSAGGKNYA